MRFKMVTNEFEKLFEFKKKYLRATRELYRSGYLDAIDDFNEKLDEARKEFPKIPEGLFTLLPRIVGKSILYKFFTEYQKAREKWFGDEEK